MRPLILALLALAGASYGALGTCDLPVDDINDSLPPKVAYVDQNDEALVNCQNAVNDSLDLYIPGAGALAATILRSDLNLRLAVDFDANATGNYFWLSHNTSDTLFRVRDDSSVYVPKLTASMPVATNANRELTSWGVTGTGTTLALSASPTLTGTLTGAISNWSGLLTASAGIAIAGGTPLTGRLVYSAADDGIILYGRTGATNDLTLYSADGGTILTNPTGTRDITLGNSGAGNVLIRTTTTTTFNVGASPVLTLNATSLTATGTVTANGGILVNGGSVAASTIYSNSTDGLVLAGRVGSAYDFHILNGSLNTVMRVPTGTVTAQFLGAVTADTLISAKFYTEGTFTISLVQNNGGSVLETGTARYVRVGKMVTLYIPQLDGTSTHDDCLLIGLPAALSPAQLQQMVSVPRVLDNGTPYVGTANIVAGGTPYIEFGFWSNATTHTSTFTTSGDKGLQSPITINYTTQ